MDELHDDPQVLIRTFSAEVTPGEGRTADVRVVPYGPIGQANDGLGGLPRGVIYDEQWLPGAFNHQLGAAHRVLANVEHEPGIGGIVGRGLALRESADGLHGSFKFLDTPNGNTALELVKDGTFGHVSLEARPVKSRRDANGIVQRIKANLVGIAFCRVPAFAGADVLALREGEPETDTWVMDESLMLPEQNREVLARAAALGIVLPEHLLQSDDLLVRAFSDDAWDGSASNYASTEAYCEACLIDDNTGTGPKVESLCHLPVKEPDGDYNVNAIRNALARVDQVDTSAAKKATAKSRLTNLLSQFNASGGKTNTDADDKK